LLGADSRETRTSRAGRAGPEKAFQMRRLVSAQGPASIQTGLTVQQRPDIFLNRRAALDEVQFTRSSFDA